MIEERAATHDDWEPTVSLPPLPAAHANGTNGMRRPGRLAGVRSRGSRHTAPGLFGEVT